MSSPARATTAWLLIAVFGIVAGVGEGLHFLPGCGHAIELPGGLIYFGISLPRGAPLPDGRTPAVKEPDGESPLVLDEDECAICSLCAQGQSTVKAMDCLPALSLGQDLPGIAQRTFVARVAGAFNARAPPSSDPISGV